MQLKEITTNLESFNKSLEEAVKLWLDKGYK